VSARATAYFAGVPTGTFTSGDLGVTNYYAIGDLNEPTTRPPALVINGRTTLSLVATGLWHTDPDPLLEWSSGPNGISSQTSANLNYEKFGIAGINNVATKFLVGVFTDDTPYNARPPQPENLDAQLWGTTSQPSLFQTFPIGASRYDIGVPVGATKLYLAFADDYQWSNNSGSVTVSAVPEPSTCMMALAGLACGGYSMWRRRKRA